MLRISYMGERIELKGWTAQVKKMPEEYQSATNLDFMLSLTKGDDAIIVSLSEEFVPKLIQFTKAGLDMYKPVEGGVPQFNRSELAGEAVRGQKRCRAKIESDLPVQPTWKKLKELAA